MVKNLALGTGRRKTSVARIYLRKGNGAITVNGRTADEYFANPLFVQIMKQPLVVTDSDKSFDIVVTVHGGGVSSQAGACRHGIARALSQYDENNTKPLRANGFLTRDPRMVERKKYGQRGARRKTQFSKR